ncbi:MAG: general secretion pathway protein GspF [Gammaproteobacteria bacterium]|nr:general secretion pathway protein GspF [Gammaproteobacteria bacterium]
MAKRKRRNYDDPIRHPDHAKPRTRREFLAQGFIMGGATVMGTALTLPGRSHATLSGDLMPLISQCGIATQGAGKIPFIVFDLAGGSNQAGSNVLVGQQGGQLDFLSTAGYERQGLPGDMIPPLVNPQTQTNDFIDQQLGLAFHSDSAFLRGMMTRVSAATAANTNGAVIPARSDNDTSNNPHNPMYGIARAGSDGSLLTLIGSENSDSGGNSMAPAMMIDLSIRPTKVDRPSDVTGLVDVGDLVSVFSQADAVAVMESTYRISDQKMTDVDNGQSISADDVLKDLVRCGYLKSADLADRFGNPATLDPAGDPLIVGANGIFSSAEFNAGDNSAREFQKTASVMKMVINGFAGAGTIEMGGYDYHGGARAEGEVKDFRAGQCMGACLEYAAISDTPLMMYVMSDGSLSSNGVIDNSVDGRGKGEWTSDNSSTAAPFFLVYNPSRQATVVGATPELQAIHQQIGYMRLDGSVETAGTPAANNVNLLAETIILNYMALHGEQGNFGALFPTHGLGNSTLQDSLTAFEPIVAGTITNPV